jgi:peptidoglycan hydrolase CwlO-like protein
MSNPVVSSKENVTSTPLWLLVVVMILASFLLLRGCAESNTKVLRTAKADFSQLHKAEVEAFMQNAVDQQSEVDKLYAKINQLQNELRNTKGDLDLANKLTEELRNDLAGMNSENEELIKVWRSCAQELSILQQRR